MKTSTAIIVAGVLFLLGVTIYSLSNRYYVDSSTGLIVNKMTGEAKEPAIKEPDRNWEDVYPWYTSKEDGDNSQHTEEKGSWYVDKGDFSKVKISGHSVDDSNPYYRTITCTVTNNDSIEHLLTVKAVFYDKNSAPILTENSFEMFVAPGGIESVTLTTFDNIESIASYELILVQSANDGVLSWSDE